MFQSLWVSGPGCARGKLSSLVSLTGMGFYSKCDFTLQLSVSFSLPLDRDIFSLKSLCTTAATTPDPTILLWAFSALGCGVSPQEIALVVVAPATVNTDGTNFIALYSIT